MTWNTSIWKVFSRSWRVMGFWIVGWKISKWPSSGGVWGAGRVLLGEKPFKSVEEFKYLVYAAQSNGDIKADVTQAIKSWAKWDFGIHGCPRSFKENVLLQFWGQHWSHYIMVTSGSHVLGTRCQSTCYGDSAMWIRQGDEALLKVILELS